jgi:hypothetical protein
LIQPFSKQGGSGFAADGGLMFTTQHHRHRFFAKRLHPDNAVDMDYIAAIEPEKITGVELVLHLT